METDIVVTEDCVRWLQRRRKPFADLIFADPPFNIGYKYDVYEDKKKYDEYKTWTKNWMKACVHALKPTGTFWVAIGDEYAAEIRVFARENLGLHLRNWVIWYYTFGQNTRKKFGRSHTHLFYFVKNPSHFTFNDEAIRTFSDRQKKYNDRRANDTGRLPDDVWTEFPRVCGTFNEREGWHPCQMPETILARIVRACSNKRDIVLDPFAGSGTTLAVAKKLSRYYVGIEISKNYSKKIKERLRGIRTMAEVEGERTGPWPEEHVQELKSLYWECRTATDTLHKNRALLGSFVQKFNARIEKSGQLGAYSLEEVWGKLERLRKQAKLGKIRVHADEPVGLAIRPLQQTLF